MTTHYLYNGTIALEYDDAAHSYVVEGQRIPSVTQVTDILNKPALVPWAAKMCAEWLRANCPLDKPLSLMELEDLANTMKGAPNRMKVAAAEVGTLVHDFILRHFTDNPMSLPEDGQARQACMAALEFCDAHRIIPVAAEFKLYSRSLGYAGTADFYGTFDGEPCLIDWKSSAGIYPEMHAQTAAYLSAYCEEHVAPVCRRAIVRFDKHTGEFNPAKDVVWREVDEFDNDMDAFESMLVIRRWLDSQKPARKTPLKLKKVAR